MYLESVEMAVDVANDGTEALAKSAACRARPQTLFIAVTANAFQDDQQPA